MESQTRGRLRVGKSKFYNGRVNIPKYDEFTNIIVLTEKSSPEYASLGPYNLKNEQGQIIECIWQFSKCYKNVPQVKVPISSGDSTLAWEWPAETHIDSDGNFTQEFWRWRMTGKNHNQPVRCPVGWKHLSSCLFSLEKDEPISESNPKLDYIESRKKIYVSIYMAAVIKEPKFFELRDRLLKGENLMIIEVDGPHQESLNYYKEKYNVSDNFIENDSVEATAENLAILLNDSKHPFGHGYCLAWALSF